MSCVPAPQHSKHNGKSESKSLTVQQRVAERIASRVASGVFGAPIATIVTSLAYGAYNHVWIVESDSKECPEPERPTKFVLRTCKDDVTSLQPLQFRNHVGYLQWLASNVPSIPIPKLYGWSDESPISSKNKSRPSANRLPVLPVEYGPTVEAAKVFNGRAKQHSPGCYNIGPYQDTKSYVVACYDREIYFYTHADSEDIEDFFDNEQKLFEFVKLLKRKRQELLEADTALASELNESSTIDAEP
ncbi:hypothetical protein BST61_g3693 [Cercospora zeina]